MQAAFSIDHGAVHAGAESIMGVASLIIWTLVAIVFVKYVTFVMRADNDGEGGVIALAALARGSLSTSSRRRGLVMTLGLVGAALFYGDGIITPAISILSAVEGVEVSQPSVAQHVPLVAAVIVVVLFVAQHRGTTRLGRAFGPVMLLWFVTMAALGVPAIVAHPAVLAAVSPTYAAVFVLKDPFQAFIALGAVVLSVTGAEALYADMGHFGRGVIRRAWVFVVFPALIVNYLGQAAVLLQRPDTVSNPFFSLAPDWALIPVAVLATAAAVIASQAVISGAFSMTQQAIRYGLLPRLRIRHTSPTERGQIYLPMVNWILFGGVLLLVWLFGSSSRLSAAYGLAVTGTFMVTTSLLAIVASHMWQWGRWRIALLVALIGVPEAIFFVANATKFVQGGWLPVLIALALILLMTTWQRGRRGAARRRSMLEGTLDDFLTQASVLPAVPGFVIYLHADPHTTPLALRDNVLLNHVRHRHAMLVSVRQAPLPHVDPAMRVRVNTNERMPDLKMVEISQGFMDSTDIPRLLAEQQEALHVTADQLDGAIYVLSRVTFTRAKKEPAMTAWRTRLFVRLAAISADPTVWFHLPPHRTYEIGTYIDV
jgi:KUP system potassium uptake protein